MMVGTLAPDFDALLASHGSDVLRVCRSILRDDHLGEDAAQETFVRLWRRRLAGAEPENAAWLRRVAVTTSLDLARTRARKSRTVEGNAADLEQIAAPGYVPELDAGELRARFEAALKQLPEGQRTIFLLKHEGGLSLVEIARTLQLHPSTVKTQFARAALALQSRLEAFRPGARTVGEKP